VAGSKGSKCLQGNVEESEVAGCPKGAWPGPRGPRVHNWGVARSDGAECLQRGHGRV